jgi:hypothetical protein
VKAAPTWKSIAVVQNGGCAEEMCVYDSACAAMLRVTVHAYKYDMCEYKYQRMGYDTKKVNVESMNVCECKCTVNVARV